LPADGGGALGATIQPEHWSALHLAACGGHAAVCELLLRRGADVNAADRGGRTPLDLACACGHVSVVAALMDAAEQRTYLNAADEKGWKPLLTACNNGYTAVVAALLSAARERLDVHAADRSGSTALMVFCSKNRIFAAQTLLAAAGERLDVNAADAKGRTALYLACSGGHAAVAQALLDAARERLDVNAASMSGWTALDSAFNNLLIGPSRSLVVRGAVWAAFAQSSVGKAAQSSAKNEAFRDLAALAELVAALLGAAQRGDAAECGRLLDAGAPADCCDAAGRSPLHLAAAGGHTEACSLLLQRGASTSLQDRDGRTAFLAAALGGHRVAGELLLTRALVPRDGGTSPAALTGVQAAGGGEGGGPLVPAPSPTVARLLLAAWRGDAAACEAALPADGGGALGATTQPEHWSALHLAACGGHAAVCELLLRRGADVNAADRGGRTALQLACTVGHAAAAQALLDAAGERLDVNAADRNGWTALLLACAGGHAAAAQALLDAAGERLDVNAADKNGWTALAAACTNGHAAAVQALLGAVGEWLDVNAANREGDTPLILSVRLGIPAGVKELLKHPLLDIGHRNAAGDSALSTADRLGRQDICELLVGSGARSVLYRGRYAIPLNWVPRTGASGVVMLGRDAKLDAAVAIKFTHDRRACAAARTLVPQSLATATTPLLVGFNVS